MAFQLFAQGQLKITSANLNLRSNPKVADNVICVIPKGTVITVDYTNQQYEEWLKISYNDKFGYVASKYIVDLQIKNKENSNFDNTDNKGTSVKYYINSKGAKVQSPTYYKSPPAGATAECNDGTYSFSQSRRGTCSHHGGVKRWL